MPSFTLLEAGERDLRLEHEALEPERADAERVEERRGFAGPRAMVQLIEGDDRALRHPRHEPLERAPGRLVQVEVQVQQRDDEMGILVEIARNRLSARRP